MGHIRHVRITKRQNGHIGRSQPGVRYALVCPICPFYAHIWASTAYGLLSFRHFPLCPDLPAFLPNYKRTYGAKFCPICPICPNSLDSPNSPHYMGIYAHAKCPICGFCPGMPARFAACRSINHDMSGFVVPAKCPDLSPYVRANATCPIVPTF